MALNRRVSRRGSRARPRLAAAHKPSVQSRAPAGYTSPSSPLPIWQQYQRIGGNLTPAAVSSILYEADTGEIYRLVQLLNESRQKDGHLQNALFLRETALSDLPLKIQPALERGRDKPRRRDVRVAEFVEDAILGATGVNDEIKSFDDLIVHMQSAIAHGHATDEIIWRRRRDGMVVPVGFRPIDQRRFRFRYTDGKLVWSDRYGGTLTGVELQKAYPRKYIQHQPRVNGDVAAFEGLSRLLVWSALFRTWTLADWLKLAELSWKPWRKGIYSKDAGKEDIDALWRILERLTTDGIALHREDHEVEIALPKGATDSSNHLRLVRFLGEEMSKAIIGQTLTTDAGDRGARSLGEVHNDVRRDIRDNDAKAVWATLRRDLVIPLVRMNFGDAPIPTVGFDLEDNVDAQAFAQTLKTQREAGMRIPEVWAHQQSGVPEPKEGERVLGDPVDTDEPEPEAATDDTPAEDDEQDDDPGIEPEEDDDDNQEPPDEGPEEDAD